MPFWVAEKSNCPVGSFAAPNVLLGTHEHPPPGATERMMLFPTPNCS